MLPGALLAITCCLSVNSDGHLPAADADPYLAATEAIRSRQNDETRIYIRRELAVARTAAGRPFPSAETGRLTDSLATELGERGFVVCVACPVAPQRGSLRIDLSRAVMQPDRQVVVEATIYTPAPVLRQEVLDLLPHRPGGSVLTYSIRMTCADECTVESMDLLRHASRVRPSR